jgi:hypothetical protein
MRLVALTCLVLFAGLNTAHGQAAPARPMSAHAAKAASAPAAVFNFKEVVKLAVYPYDGIAAQEAKVVDKSEMPGWVSDPDKLEKFTRTFNFKAYDGSRMGSAPDAFIFLHDRQGLDKVGKIVGNWRYVMFDDNWKDLHPLPPESVEVLKRALRLTQNGGFARGEARMGKQP